MSQPLPASEAVPLPLSPRPLRGGVWLTLLLAAVLFAAVAPTLPLLGFISGSENLVVATVLEVERGKSGLLLPTLFGDLRVRKPPLTTWFAAAFVDGRLVQNLAAEPLGDEARWQRLAWQFRWPALVLGCLALLATYKLGQVLHDGRLGLVAAAVAGSSLFFLEEFRLNTTDVQLAFWVLLTNLLLAIAVVQKRPWAVPAAGLTLGLAFLAKGPVALVQTLVPFAVWGLWLLMRRRELTPSGDVPRVPAARWFVVGLLAVVLFAAVALPWFVYVYLKVPGVWQVWFTEVNRQGATGYDPDNPLKYLGFVLMLFPWSVFLVVGLVLTLRDVAKRSRNDVVLAGTLLFWPVVVMVLFPDRKTRYLLPMLFPAAVVTAYGVLAHLQAWRDNPRRLPPADRVTLGLHFGLLGVVAVGLPAAGTLGAFGLVTEAGGPWFEPQVGVPLALAGGVLVLLSAAVHAWWRAGLVLGTFVTMLVLNAVVVVGFGRSEDGRPELRPLARAVVNAYPDATLFHPSAVGKRAPPDLGIYAGRPVYTPDNAADISITPGPAVLFLSHKPNETRPEPPAGWTFFATDRRGPTEWNAYVRPMATPE
ncbi:MAG: ArnT family glycosyltransferase [Phycisphaerae bacterium]